MLPRRDSKKVSVFGSNFELSLMKVIDTPLSDFQVPVRFLSHA